MANESTKLATGTLVPEKDLVYTADPNDDLEFVAGIILFICLGIFDLWHLFRSRELLFVAAKCLWTGQWPPRAPFPVVVPTMRAVAPPIQQAVAAGIGFNESSSTVSENVSPSHQLKSSAPPTPRTKLGPRRCT